MMERESEQDQMEYAQALADWGDVGGYEWETLWDVCTVAALGVPFERAQWRGVSTLSGGEQKRLVLEALLRGPDEVLLLDEPDNYLDVPAKRWLEERLVESPKTVLFVSHDRELLDRVATRIATLEPGGVGNTVWVHPGRFATYEQAREDRNARLDELRRRWDEEHAKLKALVVMYRQKAAYNSDMAARLQAAETRLRRFVEAGPPEAVPLRQKVTMRLARRAHRQARGRGHGPRAAGRRTPAGAARSTPRSGSASGSASSGATGPGKSHFLRLLAAGGSDPDREHEPVGRDPARAGGARRAGRARLPGAARLVRPDPRPRGPARAHPAGDPAPGRRAPGRDAARGRGPRAGPLRPRAAPPSRPSTRSPAGSRRACRSSCSSCPGPRCCSSTSRPTTSTCTRPRPSRTRSTAFEGTVVAVTHDRWFARGLDRFLVFRQDGTVTTGDEPVWDEGRVARPR